MPEKNLLEQKKNNLMKALNRQGADYVPTMLASSCAEVAWTGQKVTGAPSWSLIYYCFRYLIMHQAKMPCMLSLLRKYRLCL